MRNLQPSSLTQLTFNARRPRGFSTQLLVVTGRGFYPFSCDGNWQWQVVILKHMLVIYIREGGWFSSCVSGIPSPYPLLALWILRQI